ncbi:bifunctional helix-turn-helix transcriptional regulator/GNAT family N-acetyltransferase [Vibrio splendidus]|uniref:Bifunctional helix-turn-helix transcriptional regulator/GNAT family N-acetyltransferase n=1 Tax=Vibrio splendidus TaxID=29497 RepID=A0AB35N3S7_VIBSP|nr:bifunctional helix-turn-helix transcriptional regulator/GNAT family N-acetyltransferase [Vibrio splendidus]HAS24760.1 GNAT family N-acetyltransferase [Vibrio sp.]MDH5913356.1 bifunctional helix-turn-helix transcriptional regulator/GNAT family N-acetyltransferase [Vibrio splendidus]MDH5944042.1 bifunctional helix-turn-helix transcriptional regulator/GNAT family N-acetyltransferase [Vibrio splendidus]MDH5987511.1 bifunctional helix-turn-helix transcriptional regulator/GNAT family N-acetyltrans
MTSAQLRELSRQLVRQLGMLDKDCGDIALPPIQAHTLIELEQQPLTVNQLADKLNIDKSNASRAVNNLAKNSLIQTSPHPNDKRSVVASVTEQGINTLTQLHSQQNQFYDSVLERLTEAETQQVSGGIKHYLKALQQSHASSDVVVRPLQQQDNTVVANVIRQVSYENGLTEDKGYGVADPTLEDMFSVYNNERSQYWVIELDGKVVGGGGFAPLAGMPEVCELQKMYFLPETRGKGLAKRLVNMSMEKAKELGYQHMYLETTECLNAAVKLYEKLGFEHLDSAWGETGHDACEVVMAKTL